MTRTLFFLLFVPAISPALTRVVAQDAASNPVQSEARAGRDVVTAAEIIRAIRQAKPGAKLDYHGRTIDGALNFFELSEQDDGAGGKERVIVPALDFRNAVFLGKIATWDKSKSQNPTDRVRFSSEVDFNGAEFREDVNLDRGVFEADAYFSSHFRRMASFTKTTFTKFAGFRSAEFDERALFRWADFQAEADFAVTIFRWIAFFDNAKFAPGHEANFLFARFFGLANFAKAEFKGVARFSGTEFQDPAVFADGKFHDQAWFDGGARFENAVTFRRAEFQRTDEVEDPRTDEKLPRRLRAPVLFQGVIFSGEAIFADCKFQHVDFGQVDWLPTAMGLNTVFQQRADFRAASFTRLGLRRVGFQGDLDLSGANLGNAIDLADIDIARASLHTKWSQLLGSDRKPKFEWEGVYEKSDFVSQSQGNRNDFFDFLNSLEAAFQRSGSLSDAAEAHYLAQDLKGRQHSWPVRLLDIVFAKWIYGYGVRPLHQIVTALVLIVGFGLAYAKRGVLRRDQSEEHKFRLRLMDLPVDWSNSDATLGLPTRQSLIRRHVRAFQFSSYVLTKIGYGGITAGRSYAPLVIAEWLMGAVIWILFLINLSNRWPLLHRVVSAVF